MTFREIDAEDFVCHRCGRVFGKPSAQVTGKMTG